MLLDLGAVFDLAAGVVSDVVSTAGTLVDITRPGVVQAADPNTAAAATPASTTIASGVEALVVLDNPDSERESYPGAVPAPSARWKIVLTAEHIDLLRGDHVTVTVSRDDRLTGRAFEITLVIDGTPGVVRMALARAITDQGRT